MQGTLPLRTDKVHAEHLLAPVAPGCGTGVAVVSWTAEGAFRLRVPYLRTGLHRGRVWRWLTEAAPWRLLGSLAGVSRSLGAARRAGPRWRRLRSHNEVCQPSGIPQDYVFLTSLRENFREHVCIVQSRIPHLFLAASSRDRSLARWTPWRLSADRPELVPGTEGSCSAAADIPDLHSHSRFAFTSGIQSTCSVQQAFWQHIKP